MTYFIYSLKYKKLKNKKLHTDYSKNKVKLTTDSFPNFEYQNLTDINVSPKQKQFLWWFLNSFNYFVSKIYPLLGSVSSRKGTILKMDINDNLDLRKTKKFIQDVIRKLERPQPTVTETINREQMKY